MFEGNVAMTREVSKEWEVALNFFLTVFDSIKYKLHFTPTASVVFPVCQLVL